MMGRLARTSQSEPQNHRQDMKLITMRRAQSGLPQRQRLKVYRMVVVPILTNGLNVTATKDIQFKNSTASTAKLLHRVVGI